MSSFVTVGGEKNIRWGPGSVRQARDAEMREADKRDAEKEKQMCWSQIRISNKSNDLDNKRTRIVAFYLLD